MLAEVMSSVVITPTQGAVQGYKQRYTFICLPLDFVNGWLFGVSAHHVKLELRDKSRRINVSSIIFLHRLSEQRTVQRLTMKCKHSLAVLYRTCNCAYGRAADSNGATFELALRMVSERCFAHLYLIAVRLEKIMLDMVKKEGIPLNSLRTQADTGVVSLSVIRRGVLTHVTKFSHKLFVGESVCPFTTHKCLS